MPRSRKHRREMPSSGVQESVGVRIIGGKHRGRLLEYSGDLRTRPMKDRVRESVFNLVGTGAGGRHAIDLFAGTGALGLEAISRGANCATLIERHHPTCELIRKNAKTLGIDTQCQIVFGDTFLWARREFAPGPHVAARAPSPGIFDLKGETPWLVFCSPPYDFYTARRAEMLLLLTTLWSASPPQSLFVVEADESFDFGELPAPQGWDVRTYLPALIGIAERPS